MDRKLEGARARWGWALKIGAPPRPSMEVVGTYRVDSGFTTVHDHNHYSLETIGVPSATVHSHGEYSVNGNQGEVECVTKGAFNAAVV